MSSHHDVDTLPQSDVESDVLAPIPHVLDEGVQQRHGYPALMHFAVLSGFLLPFALLPYLAARRRINWLLRRVETLESRSTTLQQDLEKVQSRVMVQRNEYKQLRVWLHEAMQEEDNLRARLELQEAKQDASHKAVRKDLRKLISDLQHTRTQGAALHDMGKSLADIAAFMHEVELEMGMQSSDDDRRGVERLRQLAFKLDNIGPKQAEATCNTKWPGEQEGNKGT